MNEVDPTLACAQLGYETVDGHIALITLRRPEKRNAITSEMARALERCVQHSEGDPCIRVVVLTGGESVFCAGADLEQVAAGRGGELRTAQGGFAGLVDARRSKPWIAATAGPVMAGGCEIALSCDIIIAAATAQFALPEVRRGLVASAGGVYRLPRALPRHVAIEMIATGAPLPAERAFALGLVSEIAAPGALLDAALAKARAIAANSPLAVRESLAIARIAASTPEGELRALTRTVGDRMLASSHAREGARAFLEKRLPVWPDGDQ